MHEPQPGTITLTPLPADQIPHTVQWPVEWILLTLVNAGAQDLDLAGWSILDREKRRLVLEGGLLPSGEAVRVQLEPPVALGNRGGLITLLNPDGLKVDGVAYTKDQADAEGWSLIF